MMPAISNRRWLGWYPLIFVAVAACSDESFRLDFADEGVVEVRQPGLGLDKDEALDEVAHEGRVAALGDVAHQLDGDLIGGDAGVNGLPAGEVGDDILGDGGLEGLEP